MLFSSHMVCRCRGVILLRSRLLCRVRRVLLRRVIWTRSTHLARTRSWVFRVRARFALRVRCRLSSRAETVIGRTLLRVMARLRKVRRGRWLRPLLLRSRTIRRLLRIIIIRRLMALPRRLIFFTLLSRSPLFLVLMPLKPMVMIQSRPLLLRLKCVWRRGSLLLLLRRWRRVRVLFPRKIRRVGMVLFLIRKNMILLRWSRMFSR